MLKTDHSATVRHCKLCRRISGASDYRSQASELLKRIARGKSPNLVKEGASATKTAAAASHDDDKPFPTARCREAVQLTH